MAWAYDNILLLYLPESDDCSYPSSPEQEVTSAFHRALSFSAKAALKQRWMNRPAGGMNAIRIVLCFRNVKNDVLRQIFMKVLRLEFLADGISSHACPPNLVHRSTSCLSTTDVCHRPGCDAFQTYACVWVVTFAPVFI